MLLLEVLVIIHERRSDQLFTSAVAVPLLGDDVDPSPALAISFPLIKALTAAGKTGRFCLAFGSVFARRGPLTEKWTPY